MMVMRWLTAVILSTFIYVAAGPFIALHQIENSVERGDKDRLERYVDFDSLRENVKTQFTDYFSTKSGEGEGALGNLARGVMSQMAGSMVDNLVTPDGIFDLVRGQEVFSSGTSAQKPKTQSAVDDESGGLFDDVRYRYESPQRFSAWIASGNGEEIQWVFSREGMKWKLTNIKL